MARRFYPLFENALRAESGMSPLDRRVFLSEYLASFSKVAAGNPYAWTSRPRTAEEIRIVSASNRMITHPYTKLMHPNPYVNLGASVIIASAEAADRLGIPHGRRIYPLGGGEAADKWHVSNRLGYTSSPAIAAASRYALDTAGIDVDRIDFMDLYSCFPCATLIAARELGVEAGPDSPPTITGGLPFFGGPGSNFTMHAIVRTVERLRKNPEQYGYVSGVGYYLTKHSAGVYGGVEPESPWRRPGLARLQERLDAMPGPEIEGAAFRAWSGGDLHGGVRPLRGARLRAGHRTAGRWKAVLGPYRTGPGTA